jgi:hypothetical protein
MSGMLKACAMLGKGTPRTLAETAPDEAITIPSLEIAVRGNGSGGAWLLFRVGAHDFGVLFPERESRLLTASLLQNPTG